MGFYRQVKARISKLFATVPPSFAGVRTDTEPTGMAEQYKQAPLLPAYLQERMTDDEQVSFLQETTKANYQFQFDAPMNKDLPYNPPYEDPLREWDIATRNYILTQTHAAYQRNPLANAAVEYTADFVVGKGFNLTCKNAQVQEILEDFIENPDNRLREWERQAVIDLQVDGEILLRFFTSNNEDGDPCAISCIPQRPWELFWIETVLGNFRRPINYHFQRTLRRGDDPVGQVGVVMEDVNADEILHVAINHHGYELRGRPDLYRILPWLRADTEFLQNRARQNYWRGALLWLVRVLNGNAAQVASVAARWSRPPTAGSVAVESGNVEVAPLVNPSGGSDAADDGRQIKLRNIIGMRLPEYMFADGQNANLASATAQQLPALTRFEAYQTIMIERVWYPLFKRALQAAIDAGTIPEQVELQTSDGEPVADSEVPSPLPQKPDVKTGVPKTLVVQPDKLMPQPNMDSMMPDSEPVADAPMPNKMVDTLKAFDVTYGDIQYNDIQELANALNIAVTNEWVSNESASIKMGFDYAVEQKKIQAEKIQGLANQAAGIDPVPPESIPQPMNDPNNPAVKGNPNG